MRAQPETNEPRKDQIEREIGFTAEQLVDEARDKNRIPMLKTLCQKILERLARAERTGLALLLLAAAWSGCQAPAPSAPVAPKARLGMEALTAAPPDPLIPATHLSGRAAATAGDILTPGLSTNLPTAVEWDCDPSPGMVSNLYVSPDGRAWTLFVSTTNCEAMIDGSLPLQFYTVSTSNVLGEVFCGTTNVILNKTQ